MSNSVPDLLQNPFRKRPHQERLEIIKTGRPRPSLPKLSTIEKNRNSKYTRHFSCSKYNKVEWLAGCDVQSKLFCWTCLLFSAESNVWNKTGYNQLQHLESSIKKHEASHGHVQSFLSMKMFEREHLQTLADASLHNASVNKNRRVLKRLIDAIVYLTQQDLPLGCSDEGNFIEFLNTLRRYDTLLDAHLNTAKAFHDTSSHIQNELVEAIGDTIIDHIKIEVKAARFVALILDETSDVMAKSELATVLRYVHKGQVQERFVGLKNIISKNIADSLFSHVLNVIEEFKIQGKLIGLTFDGASVMSGNINDFQSKFIEDYPSTIITHSYARPLNLTLQNVLSNIKECRSFFQTLNGLGIFFSESSKRTLALQEFVAGKLTSAAWNSACLSNTVQEYRCEFIGFFQDMLCNCEQWESDTVIQARGFLHFLEDPQTIKLLHIFSKLFRITSALSNILQSPSLDLSHCCQIITDVFESLKYEQFNNGENIWESYVSEVNNSALASLEEKTAFNHLLNEIVENICEQIEWRFSAMSDFDFFRLLMSEKYNQFKKCFPNELIDEMKPSFGLLFDYVRLKNELMVIYVSPTFSEMSIYELINFISTNNLESCFQEVLKLGQLILTMPIYAASAEHSNSILSRIKVDRRTRRQERLCALSLISMEKKILMELKKTDTFYDEIIKKFMAQKKRIELSYK